MHIFFPKCLKKKEKFKFFQWEIHTLSQSIWSCLFSSKFEKLKWHINSLPELACHLFFYTAIHRERDFKNMVSSDFNATSAKEEL